MNSYLFLNVLEFLKFSYCASVIGKNLHLLEVIWNIYFFLQR